MDDNEKRDLEARSKPYIFLSFTKDSGCKRAEFCFVYFSSERNDEVCNYTDWHNHPKYDLADLTISAHYHDDDGTFSLYDSLCYLRRYHIGQEDCEKMGKTLKALRGKLDKIYQQLGSCSTLEDFTARVALAVGCAGFLREGNKEDGMYVDGKYVKLDVGSMQYYVKAQAREWNPKRELIAA